MLFLTFFHINARKPFVLRVQDNLKSMIRLKAQLENDIKDVHVVAISELPMLVSIGQDKKHVLQKWTKIITKFLNASKFSRIF